MAPELFLGLPYSGKVDLYAYAVLLWEMVTERAPFPGRHGVQVGLAVAAGQRPPLPPALPPPLRALITA
jgi:serine/threonine protein kinase